MSTLEWIILVAAIGGIATFGIISVNSRAGGLGDNVPQESSCDNLEGESNQVRIAAGCTPVTSRMIQCDTELEKLRYVSTGVTARARLITLYNQNGQNVEAVINHVLSRRLLWASLPIFAGDSDDFIRFCIRQAVST